MSGRALQRLLHEHGTTFRRLLDEVRHEHARGYLADNRFSDGEVAFLLGLPTRPRSIVRSTVGTGCRRVRTDGARSWKHRAHGW